MIQVVSLLPDPVQADQFDPVIVEMPKDCCIFRVVFHLKNPFMKGQWPTKLTVTYWKLYSKPNNDTLIKTTFYVSSRCQAVILHRGQTMYCYFLYFSFSKLNWVR